MMGKKPFLLLVCMVVSFVFLVGGTFAQNLECNTIVSGPDLLLNAGIAPTYASDLEFAQIRVFVHILRNTDGTGGLSDAEVDSALAHSSSDFLQIDVELVEIGREEILNTNYMGNPDSTSAEIFLENPHSDAIDIYLGPTIGNTKGRAGGIPSVELVLSGDIISNSALSHLLGNCLGLYDTDEVEFGVETVNPDNSGSAGDLVSDTLADPGLDGWIQVDCTLSSQFYSTYPSYNPPPDLYNIMSSSNLTCLSNFSNVQRARVLASVEFYQLLEEVRLTGVNYNDFTEDTVLNTFATYPMFASGIAAFDFFGSGTQKDILVSGHANNNDLENIGFAGQGSGFSNNDVPVFIDITSVVFGSDAARPRNGTTGFIVADFDNDGDLDFYAPNPKWNGVTHTYPHSFYQNDGGSFSNKTTTVFPDNYGTGTLNGAWGDYDGDGYLDLLVAVATNICGNNSQCSSASIKLFRNIQLDNDPDVKRKFVEVTSDVGIEASNTLVLSLLWIDLDQDHDMDFVTIQFTANSNPFSKLYENTGGEFENMTDNFIADSDLNYWPGSLSALASHGDFDNDGDVDIVYQAMLTRGYFENNYDPAVGEFPTLTRGLLSQNNAGQIGIEPIGLGVFDYDLNGQLDYGFSNFGQKVHRLMLNNLDEQGQRRFADRQLINSTIPEINTDARGFGFADWNLDGFTEVVIANKHLGGQGAQYAFFKYGPGTVNNHWVGIKLEATPDVSGGALPCNSRGIGATVIVTAGSHVQAQVVDGGSGNADQHDLDLSFGLGDYLFSSVEVKVIWPCGQTQITTALVDQYNTIILGNPEIVDTSVKLYMSWKPGDETTVWFFEWETNFPSDSSKDIVLFPNGVWDDGILVYGLDANMPDVNQNQILLENGKSKHLLTWEGRPCDEAFSLLYQVKVGAGAYLDSSLRKTFDVMNCPVSP